MHRLFVAIRPPEPVRARLLDLMGGIAGARWQDEDQLHLTLRFIGEVDRHVGQDVHAALGAVHHPGVEISLAGLGLFERRGAPATLWAGATPPEPLRTLHNKIDQAVARVGLPPERRAFHPHVTLARLGRGTGPGSVGAFMAAAGDFATPFFRVAEFALFESRLTPDGADYTLLERYALG